MYRKTITLRKEAYERLRAARRYPGEWEDTYRAMAAEREDWSVPDATLADGLE